MSTFFFAGPHLLVELFVDHVENLNVNGQHEEQRRQQPTEEVEVNQIVHADDSLKLTGHQEVICHQGAVVTETLQVIPAQHGCEADYEGHQPTKQHSYAGPPWGHHTFVAMATRDKIRGKLIYRRVTVIDCIRPNTI